jgi:hypothetical protein
MSWIITSSFYGYIADVDARDYLARVHNAEGQTLEPAVALAIEAFVVGCKADGIWPAIKASCILAGARTLNGALVPLVKQAADGTPQRLGTEGGWNYLRKTGLKANGTDNRIDSGRNNSTDLRNNSHNAVYITEAQTLNASIMGADSTGLGANNLGWFNSSGVALFARNRSTAIQNQIAGSTSSAPINLFGTSRNSATGYTVRASGIGYPLTHTSATPSPGKVYVFARENAGSSDPRLAFYSIGESLDLVLLDARVTTLVNAFGAVIP